MVLRIFKMIATSGFLAALECTKCVFGHVSAPDPTGGAYSATPDPLAGLRSPASLQERGGRGRRERARGRREKVNGRDWPPFANSWIRPWITMYNGIKKTTCVESRGHCYSGTL